MGVGAMVRAMRMFMFTLVVVGAVACGSADVPGPVAPMANEEPRQVEKVEPVETVQPTVEEEPYEPGYDDGDEDYGDVGYDEYNGEEGGVEGGVVGGIVGSDAPPPPPPPPPPPSAPEIIPPTVLEAARISGDARIVPDQATQDAMRADGTKKTIALLKVCIATDGSTSFAKIIKSTGYPAYDDTLRRGVLSWTYRPYLVDGKAVSICSAVTFIFTLKA
jgi:hypothetical protein